MSKKYFVTSDIHSYANIFISSLLKAGFNKDDPNHILIICGDLFDRGDESNLLYEYVRSFPANRRILIRGNHEYLLEELIKKDYPSVYDFSNGTVNTVMSMTNTSLFDAYLNWPSVAKKFKNLNIIEWIKSDEWVNYFELGPFIFTHSFIPTQNLDGYPPSYTNSRTLGRIRNWRTKATKKQWYEATWGCPWKQYNSGLFDLEKNDGKILVCGHWHVQDFRKNWLDKNYFKYRGKYASSKIFFTDHLIALDACTALSARVNILVIDEQFNCYDENGTQLNI